MKTLKLYFDITPMSHQSVRCGKGFFYQPSKIKDFKNRVAVVAKKLLPTDFKMFSRDVPLIMRIEHNFQYRKAEKKSLLGWMLPKLSKPDVTDNLQKALVDALTGIIFERDQQIFDCHAKKFWNYKDYIYVEFEVGEKMYQMRNS